jgi:flavin-dependent dehydrogenase
MSTALHLLHSDPAWAGRIVVVDKAVHPREKLCGGGITRLGADVLAGLGLSFATPHVPVREVRLVFQELAYAVTDDPVFRVVRRDEFDHWLVQQGQARGLVVRQDEAVQALLPGPDFVAVTTDRATFRARTVVAADGSRSTVRQKLKWPGGGQLARLLEVLTPESEAGLPAFRDGLAVFDFSPMGQGLQGYYWDFPSLIKGQPVMNRGVFDSRVRPERPRSSLKATLAEALARRQRNLEDYSLKGHPIYWFDRRNPLARPRILLAGDAAGADPLLGEGISFALAYGQVAAASLAEAFARQDFAFASYHRRVLTHPILGQLRWRRRLAWAAYFIQYPRLLRWFWRGLPWYIRLLAWYNPYFVPVETPRLVKVSGDPTVSLPNSSG